MGSVTRISKFGKRPDLASDSNQPHYEDHHGGGGDGGDGMLEVRVAKLEANVEDIKANIAEVRADVRDLRNSSAETRRDVAVILQKQVDIDEKLSKKPSISEMNNAISSAVNKQIIWTVATMLAISGISMTVAKLIF
ncbi:MULTISPECIES: hypothetical protein [Klebsiella pneumoniae complex]|uniref:hypothetical protein n=1 Tax=Klebsiella pneumoniae complex TaxID=3390273 RepID=UPI00210B642D|nr:hypothetical protein [Klebsiella variicola]